MARDSGPDGAITVGLTDQQALVLDRASERLSVSSAALGAAVTVDWREEMTLRGRVLGIWPEGGISANGTCRILQAADGWVAINLSRNWDTDVLPALIEGPVGPDLWESLRHWVAARPASEVTGRARLFDMAAAVHDSIPASTPVPASADRRWPSVSSPAVADLQVVDLSALWAGPLAARILRDCGASVTKVESVSRPDAARETPDFYRRLHPETQCNVVIDFASALGRQRLCQLVQQADIVIESSRPRALEQLGCGPDQAGVRRGRVWLSITGYGRHGAGAGWVAFGDDAAVAGGLTTRNAEGEPIFCGDAAADPITGILGAAAVLRSLAAGGGHLLDLPLAGAAAATALGLDPFGWDLP